MKKTLILVPGLLGHPKYLQKQVRFFQKDFNVVQVLHSNQDITPDQIAKNIASLMEAKKIKKAIVWGVSFGGLATLDFGLTYPKKTIALILGCTSYAFRFRKILKHLKLAKPIISKLPKKPIYRAITQKATFKTIFEEQSALSKKDLNRTFSIHFDRVIAAFEYQRQNELKKITAPTLIYATKKDRLISPNRSRKMHQLIKNSKLVELDLVGHMPHEVFPRIVNPLVMDFIKSLPG
jgi:pimeloyl-ACP methyl ester carboxylesterase